MTLFQPPTRVQRRALVALCGPTGSGKTFTALQWARILAGPVEPIGVIDSEAESADNYHVTYNPERAATRNQFYDFPWEFGRVPAVPPYDPRHLAALIIAADRELGRHGVLVVDSLTPYWENEGGTLDIVDNAAKRTGNSFTAWQEGTPAQRFLVNTILATQCHVIVTMRSKMAYVLNQKSNKNGDTVSVPDKVGMAPVQRAGIEYEFTIVGDMDLQHRLMISKTRYDAVADLVCEKGRSHEPALKYAEWLSVGAVPITEAQADEIRAMINTIGDPDLRGRTRAEFVTEFGMPAQVLDTRWDAAKAWVAARLPEPDKADALFVADALAAPTPAPEPEFDVDGTGQGGDGGWMCVVCGDPVDVEGETCAACLEEIPRTISVDGVQWSQAQVDAYVAEHGKHPNDPSTDAMWETKPKAGSRRAAK